MQRMPRRDTGPELALRRELHARGLRYRIGVRGLPGRPDIVFTAARLAIFVDGCFWHSCPEHAVVPRNNRGWWSEKLATNVARDRRKDAALLEIGWTPLHVWEHDVPGVAADAVEQAWEARRTAGQARRRRNTPSL
ncbi:very short patch repair endonuclease [Kineococcus sp. GCM10028916]|uniref:very short patch repair endonuclease n=1 Tax=Kineococcus sp. GCM10028916 TaxID=3273394 RepID=UPI0036295E4E